MKNKTKIIVGCIAFCVLFCGIGIGIGLEDVKNIHITSVELTEDGFCYVCIENRDRVEQACTLEILDGDKRTFNISDNREYEIELELDVQDEGINVMVLSLYVDDEKTSKVYIEYIIDGGDIIGEPYFTIDFPDGYSYDVAFNLQGIAVIEEEEEWLLCP